MLLSTALSLLAAALICIWIWQSAQQASKFRKIGCKPPRRYRYKDPIFGLDLQNKYKQAHQRGRVVDLIWDHFHEYGKTYEERTMLKRKIMTMDAKNIQVVATHIDNFGMQPGRADFPPTRQFIGRGILTMDGQYWAHSRALIRPIFARSQIANLSTFDKHFDKVLQLIPNDGSTIDLQEILKQLYLDTATEFIFGEASNTLTTDADAKPDPFIDVFDRAMMRLGARIRLGRLRFLAGESSQFWRDVSEVHSYVDKYIEQALERKSTEPASNQESPNKTYVLAQEMADEVPNRTELRHQLLNVFFPARDTIAIVASTVFFYLARHPTVYTKLRAEVLAMGPDAPLTFETLKAQPYLRYVFQEALRLQHPAPTIIRTVLRPSTLPVGGGPDGMASISLDRGDEVMMSLYCMHRDPDYWGPDASEFKPERWEHMRPTWEYIPFLGGPRICPAQQMAFTQTAYAMVKLVRRFAKCENRDQEERYIEMNKVTVESRNGCLIGLVAG